MSEDSFSEYSSESWFSRIGSSIGGALAGLVLFLVSFVVLYWNEGRAVDTARSLDEAGGAVVSAAADRVDPANEGKLVHVAGAAAVDGSLTDDVFGISQPAVRLVRTVEMYQWREHEKRETKTNVGGGQKTKKTYTYERVWADQPIDSGEFRQPEGHANPAWPSRYQGRTLTAEKVSLGAFQLSGPLVSQIRKQDPLPVTSGDGEKLPDDVKKEFKTVDGAFYRGATPGNPRVGDLRVTFAVVKPGPVSVIAEQNQNSFRAYQPKSARHTIELLQEGNHSAQAMIRAEQDANSTLTWILRLVGFFVMALGIYLVLNPLRVLGDVIPFIGNMVGFALAVFAGLVAAMLSLITIAVSWIAHRPVLAVGLLVAAGLAAVAGFVLLRRNRAAVKKA